MKTETNSIKCSFIFTYPHIFAGWGKREHFFLVLFLKALINNQMDGKWKSESPHLNFKYRIKSEKSANMMVIKSVALVYFQCGWERNTFKNQLRGSKIDFWFIWYSFESLAKLGNN